MTKLVVEIEQIRQQRGLTQVEMAKFLGINQSHYSRLTRGEIGIGRKTLRAIYQKLPELRDEAVRSLLN